MSPSKHRAEQPDRIDVRRAAALTGRHPETVRRWVWSGRLVAQREGNRLLVDRADVEALAASGGRTVSTLAAWAERARAAREPAGARDSGGSGADLVIADRQRRSEPAEPRARR